MLRDWLRAEAAGLLDWLLPPLCPLCCAAAPEREGFCATCHADILPLESPCCPHCALPYPTTGGSDHLCEDCLRTPPPFLWTAAAGIYDRALRDAVQRFKFDAALHLDRPLADLLATAVAPRLEEFAPNLLLPVPLHPERLRQRTFNQSLLLARRLGRRWRIPVEARLLRRSRATPPQPGLSAAERRNNLRGAFVLQRPLAGARVLLIDDVMTTGATARECCHVLLEGGAGATAVAVLARARRHQI